METLQKCFGKKICVAVSGGVDSTALLHYLLALKEKFGYTLCALHCEHGIRGEESLRDKAFVKDMCKRWGVQLYVYSCDCVQKSREEKTSLETAARDFRRSCYMQMIEAGKADYIATAHHVSDQAETVLFRLARGTALSGAVGMRGLDGMFIRPFLSWTKQKILAYAQEYHLQYCVDQTNQVADATRNKLRLNVFPALEEAVEGASVHLAQFAARAAEDEAVLQEYSALLLSQKNGEWCVRHCDKKPLFTRACLMAMKHLGVDRDYTQAHCNALFDLQALEKGAAVQLPRGIIAKNGRGAIVLSTQKAEQENPLALLCVSCKEKQFDGGRYAVSLSSIPIKETENGLKILRIDKQSLPENAVFRFRRAGDWIRSFGGKKTLKKYFNEKQISAEERAFVPLIADEHGGEVYVVCGVELAEVCKVREDTKEIVYVATYKKD